MVCHGVPSFLIQSISLPEMTSETGHFAISFKLDCVHEIKCPQDRDDVYYTLYRNTKSLKGALQSYLELFTCAISVVVRIGVRTWLKAPNLERTCNLKLSIHSKNVYTKQRHVGAQLMGFGPFSHIVDISVGRLFKWFVGIPYISASIFCKCRI